MGVVVPFRPKNTNRLYKYVGLVLSYMRQNKKEIALNYIQGIPKPLQEQVATTVDSILKQDGKNIRQK